MAQIAADSKGNKIRWDETKKAWVPVEKAVDDKGNTLEFDGANWTPAPKKAPGAVMPEAPKKKSFLESLKDVNWSRGGKVQGPRNPDLEMKSIKDIGQAAGSAITGMAAFPLSLAAQGAMRSRGIDKQTAQDIGQYGAGKIMVKTTTPGAMAGAEALATPFAPFSYALDKIKDPDLKMLAGAAMLAYPYAKVGIKGFIKGRLKSGKGITPKELDVIIKSTDLPPDVIKKIDWKLNKGTKLSPIRVNGGQTSIVLKDGTAIVGGRIHGETVNMATEAGYLIDDVVSGSAGFTRMDGKSWGVNGKPLVAERVVYLEDLIKTKKGKPSTRLQTPPEPTGNPIADAKAQADFLAAQKVKASAAPANSPGISVTPPAGPTTGVKVGDIPPVKPANIQPINTSPARVLAEALKQAPRLLPRQKSMYAKEAGERLRKAEEAGGPIGGEKGFEAAYAQMKGKMKKIDFELPDIGAGNRESLFQMIWDDPYLTQGERFSVAGRPETAGHSASGLTGMLDYGKFPAKHEIELMNRVFGNEVGDALIGKMSNTEQLMFWATNIANIPRTMMASFDLSAPLRQGIWLIGRPKQFGRALGAMFKSLKSEEGYNATVQAMAKKPTFKLGRERGLALSEINSALNKTEEQFIGSGMLERMGVAAKKRWPDIRGKALNLIPEGVKASQRAYTGFLNKLRADTFDSMINTQKELGLYTDKQSGLTDIFAFNEKLSSDTARYVNIASGRGNLSGLAKDHAALTNAVFFSPRLMSARLALFDPRTYFDIARVPRKVLGGKKYPGTNIEIIGKESVPKVSKAVRQEAIVDAAKFFSFYTASAMLAKFVLGQDVGKDPRSSDFTKIVSGNTSVDLSGGIGSYARTAFQLAQPLFSKLGILDDAYLVSSTSGKKTKMGGGFNEVSAGDVLLRFFSQKENPVVSFFTNILFQHDETGKPVNVAKEIKERIVPIISQDFVELYRDDPELFKMAILGTLSLFGAGVQTYPAKGEKSFVDQTTKTRQERFSGKPSGDRVIDELNKAGVKAVLGTKKVNGEPVPEADIPTVLKEAGAEIRQRVSLYLDNPAFIKATPEQRKKWLQAAVNSGWNAYKNKKKMGVK